MAEPVKAVDNNSNGRPFLPTNSWRALRQRLLRTPELALVSLAGTRCSKVRYQSSNSVLTQNYQSVLFSPIAVNKNQVTAAILLEQLLYYISLFTQ